MGTRITRQTKLSANRGKVQFEDSGIGMQEQDGSEQDGSEQDWSEQDWSEQVTEQTEQLRERGATTRKRKKNFKWSSVGILEEVSGSQSYLSVCKKCDMTCHGPCRTPNEKKIQCWAIGPTGRCTQCPGRCYWTEHVNKKYKWGSEETQKKLRANLEYVQFDDFGKGMQEQNGSVEETEQTVHLRDSEATTRKHKKKSKWSGVDIHEEVSDSGSYLSVCRQCDFTCHSPCLVPNRNKIQCWMTGPTGRCTQCPGRCYWTEHVNKKYQWENKDY